MSPRKLSSAFVMALMAASSAAAEPLAPARQAYLTNLLQHDCGSCHGLTRKGGLGPALGPVELAELDDEALVEIILNGVPGTPMPPWRPELSREEAAWLVNLMKRGAQDD